MSRQEQSRREIGRRLEDERLAAGQRIRDELNRTVMPERTPKQLSPVPPRGAAPPQVGTGPWRGVGGEGGATGIASPLIEPDIDQREYWPDGLRSSDGLFVLPAIKVLQLTDANGAAVQIQLANPKGTT